MRRRHNSPWRDRRAFTLVELLIVITILALLLSITVYSVRFALDSDRAASGASKLQSFLAGARDRAIYGRRPIGVRLFLDSEDNPNASTGQRRTVSAMYYIDSGELWSDGAIQLKRLDRNLNGRTDVPGEGDSLPFETDTDITGDGNDDIDVNGDGIADNPAQIWMVAGLKTNKWWELKRRGLLVDGVRIRIPAGRHGTWYPVDTRMIDITRGPFATEHLILQIPYADPGDDNFREARAFGSGGPETYELELPPSILPSEPGLLADGVVIDLDGSDLPASWRPGTANGFNFSQFMDIVFSPRGNVIGDAASSGLIQFYVCDKSDSVALKSEFIDSLSGADFAAKLVTLEGQVTGGFNYIPADEIDPGIGATSWVSNLADPGDPYLPKDRRIVSLFTQTGAVAVHNVFAEDLLDPFDRDGDSDFSEPDGIADDPFFFAETGEEGN